MTSRRDFIKQTLAASALLAVRPGQVLALEAAPGANAGRLVVIFLRGGLDGLYALSPVADPRLSELRPTLATRVLSDGLRLGETGFAAHPACAPLADLFAAQELIFAPCAGSTDQSRSHFQAQDLFELGSGQIHGEGGFLARAATELGGSLGAISFTREIPLCLQGGERTPEVAPLTGSGLKIPPGRLRTAILAAHRGSLSGEALELAIATEAEIQSVKGMEPAAARGSPGAGGFAKGAALMGRVLRGNPRLALAFADIGGVDTHAGQEGALTNALDGLSKGLVALKESLGGDEWRRTRVVVMSEFGRTVRENGTRGTDHGHGGLAILAGGALSGGRMLGDFHGLSDATLHESRDLPVLIDWRDLLAEAMRPLFDIDAAGLDRIFPGRPGRKWVI
jgi:uncharacterized protein (DUF1501 family)